MSTLEVINLDLRFTFTANSPRAFWTVNLIRPIKNIKKLQLVNFGYIRTTDVTHSELMLHSSDLERMCRITNLSRLETAPDIFSYLHSSCQVTKIVLAAGAVWQHVVEPQYELVLETEKDYRISKIDLELLNPLGLPIAVLTGETAFATFRILGNIDH